MSITPADIEAQTFPIAFRGYQVQSVDAFLDRLQAELGQLPAAPAAEAPTTGPTGDAAEQQAGPGRDMRPEDGAHAARALRTLLRAEQMSEQMLAEVKAEADEIRTRAHVEAEEIITAAKVESGRVESELQQRRQREVGALLMQAQQLRAEIDRLSGLERKYREALQELLSEHQRLLEQRLPVVDVETAAEASSATDDGGAAA